MLLHSNNAATVFPTFFESVLQTFLNSSFSWPRCVMSTTLYKLNCKNLCSLSDFCPLAFARAHCCQGNVRGQLSPVNSQLKHILNYAGVGGRETKQN